MHTKQLHVETCKKAPSPLNLPGRPCHPSLAYENKCACLLVTRTGVQCYRFSFSHFPVLAVPGKVAHLSADPAFQLVYALLLFVALHAGRVLVPFALQGLVAAIAVNLP